MGKKKGGVLRRRGHEGGIWYWFLESHKEGGGLVSSRISFLVGNERRVKYWKDK